MGKMLALKVYDVDYSFIIKNYLDEKMWEKEWTIFTYKKIEIKLRLDSINVKSKGIWFEIVLDDNSEENMDFWNRRITSCFKYNLSIDNIEILKKEINAAIFKSIKLLETNSYIWYTDKHKELTRMINEEDEKLREIANDFLDSENVTNDEIREAYINYYIENNGKAENLRDRYEEEMQYKILTDVYVAFLKAANDEARLKIIEEHIGKTELEKTLKKIEEYKDYMESEEFEEEMKDNLEEV